MFSLLTQQQGSDKAPPKWLEKMKGEEGVMFVAQMGGAGDKTLCNGLLEATHGQGAENLIRDRSYWECERLKQNDVDKKGSEHYFGIYFENGKSSEKCGDLKSRDQVVIYVEKDNKNKYQGGGFSDWGNGQNCGFQKGSKNANTFMIGKRDDLINLWLNTGKEREVPIFVPLEINSKAIGGGESEGLMDFPCEREEDRWRVKYLLQQRINYWLCFVKG